MPAQKEEKNLWAYETEKAENINYNFQGNCKENIRKNMPPRSTMKYLGKVKNRVTCQ